VFPVPAVVAWSLPKSGISEPRLSSAKEMLVNVGPLLYILIIVLVILAIVYLFQRVRK
jgi:hypothetical protein